MTHEAKHATGGRALRAPVEVLGQRVPGLYERTTGTGRTTYEYRGRLAGQVVNRKLVATNKTEAKSEVERLRAEAQTGDRTPTDRTLTVAQLVARFRQAIATDPAYSPRSRTSLVATLETHVVPKLGRTRVCSLDAHTIRKFAREYQPKRAKSHRNVLSALSVLLTWAVGDGFAEANAVARARERFPRDLRRTDGERFEPRALTDAEVALALAKVGKTYRPVCTFVAETGARVSEALGVRFGDVDLAAKTWSVAGQLGDDGTVRPAKTPGSMATVPLSDSAVAVVRERRGALMADGFGKVAADAFVFVGKTGQPFGRRNTLRAWQAATKAALGESLRLHDLRTTFASRLAARNVDVPTAQALLRHARPSTTLDVYTRLQGDAATKLERMRSALRS
jgi:integrase